MIPMLNCIANLKVLYRLNRGKYYFWIIYTHSKRSKVYQLIKLCNQKKLNGNKP